MRVLRPLAPGFVVAALLCLWGSALASPSAARSRARTRPVARIADLPPASDLPQPNVDYIGEQLVSMSGSYLMRYSGFDGPPNDLNPADGNQPPTVNGWQEFFQHWKQQMTDKSVMGGFAPHISIADHLFPINPFGGPSTPYPGNVPAATIPGATCPGENTLVASHPDSTPGLNTGNGSTYDDTTGVTMGMGELRAMAEWWTRNGTWPERTFKVGLFDAEEVGLIGSEYWAAHLIPPGPQGQMVLVANMDQNGMEYPAYPLGSTHTTFQPGPWYTNINASPVKDFSFSEYQGPDGGPTPGIAANMPAILHFRGVLDEAVHRAASDLGAKYGFRMPLNNPDELGASVPAYTSEDLAKYTPVQDDTLGRTDQVPFVAAGIPGYGVVGAYDSNPDDNPLGAIGPLTPLGDGSFVSIPQVAGYDTPRDNIEHLNLLVDGNPTPGRITESLHRSLELPTTWTLYLLSRPEYAGQAATPGVPIAYFESLPNALKAGDKANFDASAATDPDGSKLSYYWDFGDGATDTGQKVTHAYKSNGWYHARLAVQTTDGRIRAYEQLVRVGDADAAGTAPTVDPCGNLSEAIARGIITRAGGKLRGPFACASSSGFRRFAARPGHRGVRFDVSRRRKRPFTVDVFQDSQGKDTLHNRLVARFKGKNGSFAWNGHGRGGSTVPDGYYFARATMRLPHHHHDVRRVTLRATGGRFSRRKSFYRRESCGLLSSFKLSAPAFGGTRTRPLGISYRLAHTARATVTLLSGKRRLRRLGDSLRARPHVTYRLRVPAAGLAAGRDYKVRISVRRGRARVTTTLTSRRL
jgi:hypothetical protein